MDRPRRWHTRRCLHRSPHVSAVHVCVCYCHHSNQNSWLTTISSYPCVLDLEFAGKCQFSAPSVQAWRAVAIAVTDPNFPIPKSSGIFSIVFAIVGALMVLVRHYIWVGRLEWVKAYHPNMMCVSLAFVLPQTYCKLTDLSAWLIRNQADQSNRRNCHGHRIIIRVRLG